MYCHIKRYLTYLLFTCTHTEPNRCDMAFLWLAAIPTGLWVTKTIGDTIGSSIAARTSRRAPEPPNLYLDYEGILASANAVLSIYFPVSPTASKLKRLVEESKLRLEDLVKRVHERIAKRSWSRWIRDPDFSEENRRMQMEIDTLKNRMHIFLAVVQLLPQPGDKPNNNCVAPPFEKSLLSEDDLSDVDSECEDSPASSR